MSSIGFENNFACSEIYELSILSELMKVSEHLIQKEILEKVIEGEPIAPSMNRLEALNLDEIFTDQFFQPFWSLLFLKGDACNIQYLNQTCGFSWRSEVEGKSFIMRDVLPLAKHCVLSTLIQHSIIPKEFLPSILKSQLFKVDLQDVEPTAQWLSQLSTNLDHTFPYGYTIAHIMLYESYYYSDWALESSCLPDGLYTRLEALVSPLSMEQYFLQIQDYFDFIESQSEKNKGSGYFLNAERAVHYFELARAFLGQETAHVFCSALLQSKLSLEEKRTSILSIFEQDKKGTLDYFSEGHHLQSLVRTFSKDFLNDASLLPLLKALNQQPGIFSNQEMLHLVGTSLSNRAGESRLVEPDSKAITWMKNRTQHLYAFLFSLNPPPNYTLGSSDDASLSFYKSALCEFCWLVLKTPAIALDELKETYEQMKAYRSLSPQEYLPDFFQQCLQEEMTIERLHRQLSQLPMEEHLSLHRLMYTSHTVKPAYSKKPLPQLSRF